MLYDDRRDLSAGVKFTDADLRGMPLRVVIGERALAAGGAELSRRGQRDRRVVPLDSLTATLREEIAVLGCAPHHRSVAQQTPAVRQALVPRTPLP